MNEPLWGEMLDVLKDIGEYLAKSDTNQEQANIDKPPKTGEGQKPIKGGEAPGFGPGKNALIAKEFPGVMNEPRINEKEDIDAKEGTLLKGEDLEQLEEDEDQVNDDVLADEEEEEEEDPRREEMDPELELRSLLKDIRSALITKSSKTKESTKSSKTADSVSKAMVNEIVAEIKKSLPSIVNAESHRMLRKMGFSPSRPDIVRFGVDEEIKKSEDGEGVGLDIKKATDDLSKKSWSELGAIREKLGGFNAFQ